jgi:S-formylglutathione hydrolase FrmB
MPQRGPIRRGCLLVVSITLISSATPFDQTALGTEGQAARAPHGTIVEDIVPSQALKGNLAGDSPGRPIQVYLPPAYAERDSRRYPVVYLLHGFQGSYTQWMAGGEEWNIRDAMDRLIAAGKVRPLIVVMPDAQNKYGGSFYTNSPATGNWEDFLANDLVSFTDTKYRTIPRPSNRGIAGHSMGGYGAIRLAMKRPDAFGAVYALSAACLGWGGDLSTENPQWDQALAFKDFPDFKAGDPKAYLPQAFVAMAAAWSPNPDKPPLFVDFPVSGIGGGRQSVQAVCARWSANMPVAMVDQYRSNLARLRGIAFDVGTRDQFPHIPLTNREFARALRRNGIAHTFEEHGGDHNNRAVERIEGKLLPFFSRALELDAGSSTN